MVTVRLHKKDGFPDRHIFASPENHLYKISILLTLLSFHCPTEQLPFRFSST